MDEKERAKHLIQVLIEAITDPDFLASLTTLILEIHKLKEKEIK